MTRLQEEWRRAMATEAGTPRLPPWRVAALLLAAPLAIVAVIVATCREVSPLWMGGSVDPSYAYLLNALLVAQGRPAAFVVHPGTTLQSLGALVLHTGHAFSGSSLALQDHVLNEPEYFISAIRSVLIALVFVATVFHGYAAYRLTGSGLCAVAAQVVPFTPAATIRCHLVVMCEPLILALGLSLFGCVMLGLAREDARPAWWVFGMGLITGVAIATKFLALPFALVPFVTLPGWRRRLTFLAVAAASTAAALLPAWPTLPRTVAWLWSALSHSGYYGQGPPGLVGLDTYQAGLAVVVRDNAYVAGAGLLATLATFVQSFRSRGRSDPLARCLWAAIGAGLSLFLLLARYPANIQYAVSAASVSGLALALAHRSTTVWLGRTPRWLGVIAAGAILGSAASVARLHYPYVIQRRPVLPGALEANRAASRLGRDRFIYGYVVSTIAAALSMGNEWCGRSFSAELRRLYPDTPSFDWGGIHHFGRPVAVSELARRVVDGDSLLIWDTALAPQEWWHFFRGLSVESLGRYGRDRLLRARFVPLDEKSAAARPLPPFAGLLILAVTTNRPVSGGPLPETLAPLGPAARFAVLGDGGPLRLVVRGRYEGEGVQTLRLSAEGQDIGSWSLPAGRWQRFEVALPPRTGLFELVMSFDRLFPNPDAARAMFPGYGDTSPETRWPAVRFQKLQVWRPRTTVDAAGRNGHER